MDRRRNVFQALQEPSAFLGSNFQEAASEHAGESHRFDELNAQVPAPCGSNGALAAVRI